MILFVASNPSRLNTNPLVPMVGSKSYKTFKKWADYLSPESSWMVMNVSNKVTEDNGLLKRSDYELELINVVLEMGHVTKVVALGNTAADALELLGVEYYKPPHPSPRNRFLNNKVQVEAVWRIVRSGWGYKCHKSLF